MKIRGRRKDKEKLPSGITADYSASFFAQLDIDRELDRGTEEVVAIANTTTTIDVNGELIERVQISSSSINISQSDSSETSLNSMTNNNNNNNNVSHHNNNNNSIINNNNKVNIRLILISLLYTLSIYPFSYFSQRFYHQFHLVLQRGEY